MGYSGATTFYPDVSTKSTSCAPLTGGGAILGFRGADSEGLFAIYDADGVEVLAPVEFEDGVTYQIAVTELDNGNIFIAYKDNDDNEYGKFVIYTTAGVQVVGPTTFESGDEVENVCITLLNNTNVFIAYSYTSSLSGQFVIIDEDGVEIKGRTQFHTKAHDMERIATLADTNVVIAWHNFSTDIGYFIIYDEDGAEVKGVTEMETSMPNASSFECVVLSNSNFAIIYHRDYIMGVSVAAAKVRFYEQDGTFLLTSTFVSVNAYDSNSSYILGNYLIITNYTSGGASLYYTIYNDDGVQKVENTLVPSSGAEGWVKACATGNTTGIVLYGDSDNINGDIRIFNLDHIFNTSILKKKLVTVANNSVFYEDSAGSMVEISDATGTLDTEKDVIIFEGYQKAFIANDTTFKVVDFGNVKLSTADIGAVAPIKGTILTGGSSVSQMVVDFISADTDDAASLIYGRRITVATFTSGETVTGTNDPSGNVSFSLNANEVLPDPPHYYNWTPYADNTTTYGAMPDRATLGCLYRGRAVLSGDSNYPHQWYMSRQANPWDWLYSSTDAQAPVAGNNADAGEIGDIIVALIPYRDDNLIFGCSDSMYILHGDPASGGSIDELSLVRGMFGKYSYCWDDSNNLYVLDSEGLYIIPAGFQPPQNLSDPLLPTLVQDWALDPTLHTVTMAYDRSREGILICKTTLATGVNENYWYSLKTKGFFPETYPNQCGVYSFYYYSSTEPTDRNLLIGSADGYLRVFDDSVKSDDIGGSDQAIDSYVTFGPTLMVGDIDTFGKLVSLSLVGAVNSSDIDCKLFVGKTAENIITQLETDPLVPIVTTTITSFGRPKKLRQRIRGTFMGLQLRNNTLAESWSMETIVGVLQPAGNV